MTRAVRFFPMHTIRLRGPWQYEVLSRSDGAKAPSAAGKQKMPADWSETLGGDFYGTVRYRRTFHSPTGLEEGQPVWLVVEGVRSRGHVTLNSQTLAHTCHRSAVADAQAGGRFSIEHLLSRNNELIIDVEHLPGDEGTGGLTGTVRLEIQTVRPRPDD